MFNQGQIISCKLEQHIEDLLEALGLDLNSFMINDKEIRGTAPCHEGADNPTAFSYSYDHGCWQCFSNGCHKKLGADPLGLIRAVKKCHFEEAIKFAQEFLEGKPVSNEFQNRRIVKSIVAANPWQDHLNQETFNEQILHRLEPPMYYSQFRKLDYNLVRKLGGGIAKRGCLNGRFVLPVRNIRGQIVGFTARKLKDGVYGPKWLHWPDSFRKNLNLYNLDRAYRTINGNKSIILTEGPIDAIKLEMAGYKNVVALLGSNLSDEQITLLLKSNVVTVYLALDNDEPGRRATEMIVEKLEKNLFEQYIIDVPGEKKDWGECSLDEIRGSLSNFFSSNP